MVVPCVCMNKYKLEQFVYKCINLKLCVRVVVDYADPQFFVEVREFSYF